jgi:hypothetical protein
MRLIALFALAASITACGRYALTAGGNDDTVDAALAPDLASGSCAGLDEATCRATPACKAWHCFACSCKPAFAGCLPVGEPGPECPSFGCPQPQCCSSASDCPTGPYECVAPGASPGCDPCIPSTECTSDADCAALGPNQICNATPCSCTPNGMACEQGCGQASDCNDPALGCENHRCVPKMCQSDVDCPRLFHCSIGGIDQQRCVRNTCKADVDCGDGFCVDGSCYDSLGMCLPFPG